MVDRTGSEKFKKKLLGIAFAEFQRRNHDGRGKLWYAYETHYYLHCITDMAMEISDADWKSMIPEILLRSGLIDHRSSSVRELAEFLAIVLLRESGRSGKIIRQDPVFLALSSLFSEKQVPSSNLLFFKHGDLAKIRALLKRSWPTRVALAAVILGELELLRQETLPLSLWNDLWENPKHQREDFQPNIQGIHDADRALLKTAKGLEETLRPNHRDIGTRAARSEARAGIKILGTFGSYGPSAERFKNMLERLFIESSDENYFADSAISILEEIPRFQDHEIPQVLDIIRAASNVNVGDSTFKNKVCCFLFQVLTKCIAPKIDHAEAKTFVDILMDSLFKLQKVEGPSDTWYDIAISEAFNAIVLTVMDSKKQETVILLLNLLNEKLKKLSGESAGAVAARAVIAAGMRAIAERIDLSKLPGMIPLLENGTREITGYRISGQKVITYAQALGIALMRLSGKWDRVSSDHVVLKALILYFCEFGDPVTQLSLCWKYDRSSQKILSILEQPGKNDEDLAAVIDRERGNMVEQYKREQAENTAQAKGEPGRSDRSDIWMQSTAISRDLSEPTTGKRSEVIGQTMVARNSSATNRRTDPSFGGGLIGSKTSSVELGMRPVLTAQGSVFKSEIRSEVRGRQLELLNSEVLKSIPRSGRDSNDYGTLLGLDARRSEVRSSELEDLKRWVEHWLAELKQYREQTNGTVNFLLIKTTSYQDLFENRVEYLSDEDLPEGLKILEEALKTIKVDSEEAKGVNKLFFNGLKAIAKRIDKVNAEFFIQTVVDALLKLRESTTVARLYESSVQTGIECLSAALENTKDSKTFEGILEDLLKRYDALPSPLNHEGESALKIAILSTLSSVAERIDRVQLPKFLQSLDVYLKGVHIEDGAIEIGVENGARGLSIALMRLSGKWDAEGSNEVRLALTGYFGKTMGERYRRTVMYPQYGKTPDQMRAFLEYPWKNETDLVEAIELESEAMRAQLDRAGKESKQRAVEPPVQDKPAGTEIWTATAIEGIQARSEARPSVPSVIPIPRSAIISRDELRDRMGRDILEILADLKAGPDIETSVFSDNFEARVAGMMRCWNDYGLNHTPEVSAARLVGEVRGIFWNDAGEEAGRMAQLTGEVSDRAITAFSGSIAAKLAQFQKDNPGSGFSIVMSCGDQDQNIVADILAGQLKASVKLVYFLHERGQHVNQRIWSGFRFLTRLVDPGKPVDMQKVLQTGVDDPASWSSRPVLLRNIPEAMPRVSADPMVAERLKRAYYEATFAVLAVLAALPEAERKADLMDGAKLKRQLEDNPYFNFLSGAVELANGSVRLNLDSFAAMLQQFERIAQAA